MKNQSDLFLLQKFDNGDFFIYGWTTILATKGYKVLTKEESTPYIKLIKEGKNNLRYLKAKEFEVLDEAVATDNCSGVKWDEKEELRLKREQGIETDEVIEAEDELEAVTESIIDKAVSVEVDAPQDLDEVRNINISQEDIQLAEQKHIKGLRHKSTVEKHMLEKYQMEIPPGKLDVMKATANNMIVQLAKANRLYTVDGKITTK